MPSLGSYIKEVLADTSHIFDYLRKYIKELIVAMLDEGVYIDYVWFAISHCKEIEILAIGYDEEGIDVEVTGKWQRDMTVVSDIHAKQFNLVDVLVEEL